MQVGSLSHICWNKTFTKIFCEYNKRYEEFLFNLYSHLFVDAEYKKDQEKFETIQKNFDLANASLPTHWNGREIDMVRIIREQKFELQRIKLKSVNRGRRKCRQLVRNHVETRSWSLWHQVTLTFHTNFRSFSSATSTKACIYIFKYAYFKVILTLLTTFLL